MTTRRTLLGGAIAASLAAPATAQPEASHRRALAQCRLAQQRADGLLRRQGLVKGSVAERLRALARDERWLYPDDDAGRDRAVADMNARLEALRPSLARAFGDLPIPPAEARRMPAAEAAAGKAGYREAPAAGRPGVYYVDLKAIRTRPAWSLPSVAFHEVVPGHLLQLGVAGKPAPGPGFEGWAIYAEQLAADLGAYRTDPLGEIGYLQWRLFRLGRIVADTGLQALGWSRDRAIAAMTELQGQSVAFIIIEADVDRMIATPGKAAAEGLAALDLAASRPADSALWPIFHRRLLDGQVT
jgi:uncharacterized protein (DUF885 family)